MKPGELVAVVGQVGAGKSSLIQAVLGEMEKLDGNVNINVSTPTHTHTHTHTRLSTHITCISSLVIPSSIKKVGSGELPRVYSCQTCRDFLGEIGGGLWESNTYPHQNTSCTHICQLLPWQPHRGVWRTCPSRPGSRMRL